jgi:hypothetical protein
VGHHHDSEEQEGGGAAILRHIKALIAAHMPDDSQEALANRKLVGKFTVMYLNLRLAEHPERTRETENLLTEVAFWWAMHHVATNVHPGNEPPKILDDLKKLS